jgi:thioredoxin-related protein
VKENKVPYECVLGDPKTQAKIPDFEGYPTTLFIDKAGKVRLKVVGYHPMAQLEALVKQLMSE